MIDKEKYENVFIWVLAFAFIGLAGLGLWLLKTISILPIIVLFSGSLLSFLYMKSFDLSKSKEDPTAFTISVVVISVICCALVVFGNKKDRATIARVFVNGKIEKQYYDYEYENGRTETKYNYVLKPINAKNNTVIEIIDWVIVILSLFCVGVNFKICLSADKLRKQQKFIKKYPKWTGEIPTLED